MDNQHFKKQMAPASSVLYQQHQIPIQQISLPFSSTNFLTHRGSAQTSPGQVFDTSNQLSRDLLQRDLHRESDGPSYSKA